MCSHRDAPARQHVPGYAAREDSYLSHRLVVAPQGTSTTSAAGALTIIRAEAKASVFPAGVRGTRLSHAPAPQTLAAFTRIGYDDADRL